MHRLSSNRRGDFEDLLAEVTDAAYRAALTHGIRDSFLALELDLWEAVRTALLRHRRARAAAGSDLPNGFISDEYRGSSEIPRSDGYA
jgi:hypothetical protein